MNLKLKAVKTPVGPMTLIARGDALVALSFSSGLVPGDPLARHLELHLGAFALCSHADPAGAATRLAAYFDGDLDALRAQPVELHGTPFQLDVWRALQAIPVGTVIAYRTLAERVGRPDAWRAVGAANGANPVAVFVPCHRVIASGGGLGGYGGGLPMKTWLLRHERAWPAVEAQGTLALAAR